MSKSKKKSSSAQTPASKMADAFESIGRNLRRQPADTKKAADAKKGSNSGTRPRSNTAALNYAKDKARLSGDFVQFLKDGSMSDDLIHLLRVSFARPAVRDLVSVQPARAPEPEARDRAPEPEARTHTPNSEGKPGTEEYYLDFRFVLIKNGDWCNKQAEALLSAETSLLELQNDYGIDLRVVRRLRTNDEEQEEGNRADYTLIKKEIQKEFPHFLDGIAEEDI